MAKFLMSRLVAVIMMVAVAMQLIITAECISRRALRGGQEAGYRVGLRHVDHAKNLTKLERLRRAVLRANQRLEQLSVTAASSRVSVTGCDTTASRGIEAPIHPGQGEFLMNLSIGTPPLPYSAIVDTGSDLIWTQCSPCLHCYTQPSPIFSPSNSSSYHPLSCNTPLCNALPLPSCSDDSHHCQYTYEYGDYSTTSGTLASETFSFSSSSSVSNVAFGCGDENQGGGFDQGGGLVGLGRGPLSLVSQLKVPKFSYCLTSISADATDDVGTLLLGSLADAAIRNNRSSASVTTPLATNPSQPSFYYVNLQSISVGGTKLPIPESAFTLKKDGSGGMIIDSGTTITYLDEAAYGPLRKEVLRRVNLELADNATTEDTGLDLCFKMPGGNSMGDVDLPTMVFHFEGGDVEIPTDSYMLGLAGDSNGNEDMLCLAMGSASGMSVFGNVQQQNLLVVHDLRRETLTFLPTNCDSL